MDSNIEKRHAGFFHGETKRKSKNNVREELVESKRKSVETKTVQNKIKNESAVDKNTTAETADSFLANHPNAAPFVEHRTKLLTENVSAPHPAEEKLPNSAEPKPDTDKVALPAVKEDKAILPVFPPPKGVTRLDVLENVIDADIETMNNTLAMLHAGWAHVRSIQSLCRLADATTKTIQIRRQLLLHPDSAGPTEGKKNLALPTD